MRRVPPYSLYIITLQKNRRRLVWEEIAELTPEKLQQAGGYRYTQARRPELYKDIIGADHKAELKVVWMDQNKTN